MKTTWKWMTLSVITAAVMAFPIIATAAAAKAAPKAPVKAAANDAAPNREHCGICDTKTKIKEAVPWLDLGADQRIRMMYDNNNLDLNNGSTTDDRTWYRFRTRVLVNIRPLQALGVLEEHAKDLQVNFRMVFEPRYYHRPDGNDWIRDEVLIDRLNITWKKAFGLPLTIIAGRQDIALGHKWLVFEGTPGDGSRTIYFDAIRTIWDLKDCNTTLDLIYIRNRDQSAQYLKPINDLETNNSLGKNSQGVILYVRNKSIKDTMIDGYFIYKHDDVLASERWSVPDTDNNDIYTFGAAVDTKLTDRLTFYGELAYQFGKRSGADISAAGFNSSLTYDCQNDWKGKLFAQYEWRSGDRDKTGQDEGFDILWGQYPAWSNIFQGGADGIDGRGPAQSSNIHRITAGYSFEPCSKVSVVTHYTILFAGQNSDPAGVGAFSKSGNVRGHQLAATAKYKYNEHLSFAAVGEVFIPADYYNKVANDTAVFGMLEAMLTW